MPTPPPPLSVYVHTPWCERKCPYCDFNSHATRGPVPEQDYVRAVLADLDQELPDVWGRRIRSVFIGGGTPSLFSVDALAQLLSGLRARLNLLADAEITLEANPGSSEGRRFAGYRKLGINRLSLGVQSFNDSALRALGRVHDANQAHSAIAAAQAAGFDNLNLDLMYGLPGQTPDEALADVTLALASRPAHLSYYQLTLEPNTYFHVHPPLLPDEQALDAMEAAALPLIADAGYLRYEVSAYAQPGFRCRHNLNYWQFGDYLGLGAGAHGKITNAGARTVRRYAKQRQPAAYMRAAAGPARVVRSQTLSDEDLKTEFMLNALRLTEGFEATAFRETTGLPYARVAAHIEALRDDGLLQVDGERIAATPTGYRFLNEVLARFSTRDARRA